MVFELELYKPKEFPVLVGNPDSSIALCTVWQDAEMLVNSNPEFKNKFSIIGNLRSPFGINLILYNLAQNPHIKDLIVWGPDKLSNTDIGLAGKNTLVQLWQKGLDHEKKVAGAAHKLLDEIDVDVVKKIIGNVKLHEWSDRKQLDLNALPNTPKESYMEKVKFPEFKVKTPETLPSENYIFVIREKKGADAFLTLLRHIWKYGEKTPINIGEPEVRELRGTVVVVEDENPDDIYVAEWLLQNKELNISKEALENYFKSQFSPDIYYKTLFGNVKKFERPKDYSYLYAEQIFAFPRPQEIDKTVEFIFENGGYEASKKFIMLNSTLSKDETDKLVAEVEKSNLSDKEKIEVLLEGCIPRINQIANVIDRIKRKAPDLDKEIITWDPRYHTKIESGRPCITKISFTVRKGKVDMHAFVRTHDVTQAWFFNFYGLTKLLGQVAKETGYKPGYIIVESQSAQIYQRDWNTVEKILKEQFEDKPVRMYFDPKTDADPRGTVNIAVLDGKINLKLFSPGGELLLELEGRTAKEVMYKMKHNHLLSKIDHSAFIGSELSKAEMCMKLGIEYKFDAPLKLPSGEKIIS